MVGNQFEFRFAAEAGRYYTVEFRNDFGVQDFLNWTVLTNLTASSTNVLVVQTNAVESRRFYRVRSP